MFRLVLGVSIGVVTVAAALYVGVWIMLIGGIVQLITEIKGDFDALGIAWGVARILLASLAATLTIVIGFVTAKIVIGD